MQSRSTMLLPQSTLLLLGTISLMQTSLQDRWLMCKEELHDAMLMHNLVRNDEAVQKMAY